MDQQKWGGKGTEPTQAFLGSSEPACDLLRGSSGLRVGGLGAKCAAHPKTPVRTH